jgi:hypothetical protein
MAITTITELHAYLEPFQIAALTIDVTWVFGPTTPLPGKWDCRIRFPRTWESTVVGGKNMHGGGDTPDAALLDALRVFDTWRMSGAAA